ncbi:MAG: hypothetical protein U9N44_02440 [Chloroflexota bacterium]|nr:hypothetical protein [Chloroflexota bacterium]
MKTYPKIISLLGMLLVLSMVLVACGGGGDKTPTPEVMATPTQETGWYWKAGGFIDYAPSGMPDFDQKQDNWFRGATAPFWSYCGPVAMANSLWWFDSEFEPNPVAPPTINDNYELVESYATVAIANWDDHDTQNVIPFVDDLAGRMDTDGQTSGDGHFGTTVEDMAAAINQYLIDKDLDDEFYVHVVKSPKFDWIAGEIERCQDVVLLLGFWQLQTDPTHGGQGDWVRVGGHYVTCAGVNSDTTQLGVSDPYRDNAEAGGAGVVPVAHAYPHNASVHNDAQYVSHDIFDISQSDSPGGLWKFDGYADDIDVANFEGQNWAEDLIYFEGEYDPDLPVQTEIDYAIAVSPVEESTPTPGVTPTPTQVVPTPTPTQVPPKTPTPGPTQTPSASPTPDGSPTATGTPAASPTATPTITPDPSAPVITGIHSTHTANASGGIDVKIHCIPAYFPNGSNIWDLHFFAGDTYLGSEYFDAPLVPCTWYTFHVDTETSPECITIYLTDEFHNTWGQIASWLVDSTVEDLTTNLTGYGTGIFPGTTYWEIEIYPNPERFGDPGTPTDIYDLHFYALENCDPIPIGVEYFQEPLLSGEWYDFILDWSSSYPPPEVVLVEVSDVTRAVWGVAWSWPYIE